MMPGSNLGIELYMAAMFDTIIFPVPELRITNDVLNEV